MDPLEREIRYVRGGRPREGAFALWLARERLTRRHASDKKEWTADDVLRRIREQRGYTLSHSTYASLESGARQPTAEQYQILTEFFGSTPPDTPPLTGDEGLTETVRALVEEVRLARQEQKRANDVMVDLLGLLAGERALPSGTGAVGPARTRQGAEQ